MTMFLDAAIFMYAAGSSHPLRDPCRSILSRAVRGELLAATSVEVVQELVHRYLSIRRPELAASSAREVAMTFGPLIPITHATVVRLPELIERYPGRPSRDLVHLATCMEEGIGEIVTPDRDFDDLRELRRIDPLTFAA